MKMKMNVSLFAALAISLVVLASASSLVAQAGSELLSRLF
jgi:hypothetical protein